jgi:ComF family protein
MFRNESVICSRCLTHLPIRNSVAEQNHVLLRWFPDGDNVIAAYSFLYFRPKGICRNLIHHFKYSSQPDIGRLITEMFVRQLNESAELNDIDVVIPVPMNVLKIRQRGYNQSAVIADTIAKSLGIEHFSDALLKVQNISSQTKAGRHQRFEKIAMAYKLADNVSLLGRRVLLVDDVLTTGATLRACANALRHAQPEYIKVLTLARTA